MPDDAGDSMSGIMFAKGIELDSIFRLQTDKLFSCIAMPFGPPSCLLRALTSLNNWSGPMVFCSTGD
jgi:hypothetical protein